MKHERILNLYNKIVKEVEEQQKFNFLLAQAAEFQQKIDIYSKALEDVQENAQEQMKEVQEKQKNKLEKAKYFPINQNLY